VAPEGSLRELAHAQAPAQVLGARSELIEAQEVVVAVAVGTLEALPGADVQLLAVCQELADADDG